MHRDHDYRIQQETSARSRKRSVIKQMGFDPDVLFRNPKRIKDCSTRPPRLSTRTLLEEFADELDPIEVAC